MRLMASSQQTLPHPQFKLHSATGVHDRSNLLSSWRASHSTALIKRPWTQPQAFHLSRPTSELLITMATFAEVRSSPGRLRPPPAIAGSPERSR